MAIVTFAPPSTPVLQVVSELQKNGFAVLAPPDMLAWSGCDASALEAMRPDWESLPPDMHMKDGGRYRRRRHSCFVVRGADVQPVPHRAHWQPLQYNALHGGMERWFEPMSGATVALPAWQQLLVALCGVADALFAGKHAPVPWSVEAHQFRIDTQGGIGRPTPEGAHRDGVDLVAVLFVGREGVKGGETRVFEAHAAAGQRFTLTQPWSLLLLDDARMVHESTPILPLQDGAGGHRDTLVLTYRRGGFQGQGAAPVSGLA